MNLLDVVSGGKKVAALIGSEWRLGNQQYNVTNPANGEVIAQVADLGSEDTLEAVAAAEKSGKEWRKVPVKQRARLLRRWYDLVIEETDALAQIMTLEQGKPLHEARGEVVYGASFIEYFGEECKRVLGDVSPGPDSSKRILVLREPVGVVAAITPWNFPLAMITRKCAPALAAGCTIVIKPAESTPLTALALASLAQKAGIPDGVINVVTCSRPAEVGDVLSTDSRIRKLSFTGSTPVGKHLLSRCASTVKKTAMELGGNAPFIVFDDANLDAAVEGAIASKFRNAGQTCVCTNRFLVQAGVYDAFLEKLTDKVRQLRVGNGLDEGVFIGPLINAAAVEKVQAHVNDGLMKGARLLCGGKVHELGGHFFAPTVLADVTVDMLVASEETFGPLAAVFKFESEAEAVEMANQTPFGLAAYFYTNNYRRIFRTLEALEYGMVGVNEGLISTELAPFGGIKESGLGREGSRYGLEEFTELKYACLGGID